MSEAISKQQLLEQFHAARANWEALLAEIGPQRMERAGVMGDWTMKDTIAHLITWWRRAVACLAAAQRGERPPDHPPQTEVAIINQWEFLTNRDRPLADILHDAAATWEQFEALLQAIPEATLSDTKRFTWMEGRPIGAGMIHDFLTHLDKEHEPLIRNWLAHQPNQ